MHVLKNCWGKLEEYLIILSLALMTLVTFTYVVFNNIYTPFFDLADKFPSLDGFFTSIALFSMSVAQEMTWSVALTKLFFGVLIFLGASYGVRTAGHIGVDLFVKRFNTPIQRIISMIACLACIGYALFVAFASYEWLYALFTADIGAEDLQQFGIKLWYIGMIIPLGYIMVFARFIEILIRLIQGKQVDLGLADEAKDAIHLQEGHHS